MDAKGAKDTPGRRLLASGWGFVQRLGTRGATKEPEGVPKVLQGSLWLRLSHGEQSFAALASFASLAVCSCR